MYKASIELCSITKIMKLKFNIIITPDVSTGSNFNQDIIQKFSYMNNDYLKINPKPFVTIDISKSKDKNDGWSFLQSVNLNRKSLFMFQQKLVNLLRSFSIGDLFYYDNNLLRVNKKISSNFSFNLPLPSQKMIHMEPIVVPGENENDMDYEGVLFCINSYDNYCYLLYDEAAYLSYEINKIDMTSLSLQLINVVKNMENIEAKKLAQKVITKEEEYNTFDNKPVKIEYEKEIPNI